MLMSHSDTAELIPRASVLAHTDVSFFIGSLIETRLFEFSSILSVAYGERDEIPMTSFQISGAAPTWNMTDYLEKLFQFPENEEVIEYCR
jgi:hypothetical protein